MQGSAFPGLLSLVYMYLDTLDVEVDSRRRIEEYLDLIRRRTDGSSPLPPYFWTSVMTMPP